jgi:hypothetical protein
MILQAQRMCKQRSNQVQITLLYTSIPFLSLIKVHGVNFTWIYEL